MLPIGMLILSAATIDPIRGVDKKSIFLGALVGLAKAWRRRRRRISSRGRGRERAFACGRVRVQGFNVGSVLGLVVAPLVIEATNWRTVSLFHVRFDGTRVAENVRKRGMVERVTETTASPK